MAETHPHHNNGGFSSVGDLPVKKGKKGEEKSEVEKCIVTFGLLKGRCVPSRGVCSGLAVG